MVSIDRVYYKLLFGLFYMLIGPWSFHEIVDGTVGYFFVWGTFVKGEFVPGTLHWWYGCYQLLFLYLPLTIIIAGVLQKRLDKLSKKSQDQNLFQDNFSIKLFLSNLPFVVLMLTESVHASIYLVQNGFFAFCTSPIPVWSIAFSFHLFHEANCKVSDQTLKQCSPIFKPKSPRLSSEHLGKSY